MPKKRKRFVSSRCCRCRFFASLVFVRVQPLVTHEVIRPRMQRIIMLHDIEMSYNSDKIYKKAYVVEKIKIKYIIYYITIDSYLWDNLNLTSKTPIFYTYLYLLEVMINNI